MKKFSFLLVSAITILSYAQVIPEGVYSIRADGNPSFCLDLDNGKTRNGQNVLLWSYWGAKWQKWIVTHKDSGIVIRSLVNTNYVIDLNGGFASNGRNIHVWEYNGTKAQIWYPEYVKGYYILHSAVNNDFCIDIDNGNTTKGQNIHCWEFNRTIAQRWRFEPIDEKYEVGDYREKPTPLPNACPICGATGHLKQTGNGTYLCDKCGGAGFYFKSSNSKSRK